MASSAWIPKERSLAKICAGFKGEDVHIFVGAGIVAVYQSWFRGGAYLVEKGLHGQGRQFFCLFFFKIVFHQFAGFI